LGSTNDIEVWITSLLGTINCLGLLVNSLFLRISVGHALFNLLGALYVLLTVLPCIISQTNPTRCTVLFNIFIYFSSLHVSGIHVPTIRRKLLYLCDTGICHSLWVATGLLVGVKSNQQTRRHPYRVTNTSIAWIK